MPENTGSAVRLRVRLPRNARSVLRTRVRAARELSYPAAPFGLGPRPPAKVGVRRALSVDSFAVRAA